MSDDLLGIALSAAVPLWIREHEATSFEDRRARAQVLAGIVGSHGDDILFRGAKKGATATAFDALAEGLAIAAYQPGGVTFAGQRWEA